MFSTLLLYIFCSFISNSRSTSDPKIAVYLLKSNGKSILLHEPSSQNNGNISLGEWDGPLDPDTSKFRYRLDCFATYPIRIVYNGHGGPKGLIRNNREIKNSLYYFQDSSKYEFVTKFYFMMSERNTGNYTCSSWNKEIVGSTSLYVFVEGKHGFVLDSVAATVIPDIQFKRTNIFSVEDIIDNDKLGALSTSIGVLNFREYLHDNDVKFHLRIPISKEDTWANIPCSVTNKKSNVLLYKIDASNNWKYLRSNETFLKYDPKKGYDLKLSRFKDVFNSSFLCAIDNIKTMINVRFFRVRYSSEEVDMKVDGNELTCSTNSAHLRLGFNPCFSLSDCEFSMALLKNTYYPNQVNQDLHKMQTKMEFKFKNNHLALLTGILHCSTRIWNLQSLLWFNGKLYNDLSMLRELKFPNSMELIEYSNNEYPEINSSKPLESLSNRTYLCSASSFTYAENFIFIIRTMSGASYNLLGKPKLSIKFNEANSDELRIKSYIVVIEKLVDPIRSIVCYAPLISSRAEWHNVTLFPVNSSFNSRTLQSQVFQSNIDHLSIPNNRSPRQAGFLNSNFNVMTVLLYCIQLKFY